MYEAFYGLHEPPFDLTPNPAFIYMSAKHREALSNVEYGISGRKGITLVIGEAGTGKTTVLRTAMVALASRHIDCVYVNNPTLTRAEFYELLATGFRLPPRAAQSKARFLLELLKVIADRQREGQATALIIDEAQALPFELLEELRLLSNLETTTEKLLPVVLAGQPELAARLRRPELRQLKQRVALRCELKPLNLPETSAYIAGRLWIAGGDVTSILTREAVRAVFDVSRGIPRTISVVCDNVLVAGFAANIRPIDADLVAEVCRDFEIESVSGGEDLPFTAPTPRLSLAREPAEASRLSESPVAASPEAPNDDADDVPEADVEQDVPVVERLRLFGHFERKRRRRFFFF